MSFDDKVKEINANYVKIFNSPSIQEIAIFIDSFTNLENEYEMMAVMGYMSHALRLPNVKSMMLSLPNWVRWAKKNRMYIDAPLVTGRFKAKNPTIISETEAEPTLEEVNLLMEKKMVVMNNFDNFLRHRYGDDDGAIFKTIETSMKVNDDKMVDIDVKVLVNYTGYITAFMLDHVPNQGRFEEEFKELVHSFIFSKRDDDCYRFAIELVFLDEDKLFS